MAMKKSIEERDIWDEGAERWENEESKEQRGERQLRWESIERTKKTKRLERWSKWEKIKVKKKLINDYLNKMKCRIENVCLMLK